MPLASTVDQYRGIHDGSLDQRRDKYVELVNHFYDLVTDFYEYGWGTSFHFAPREAKETLADAIEASCHAPHRVALFREVARVMKPGASFAGYEWCPRSCWRW